MPLDVVVVLAEFLVKAVSVLVAEVPEEAPLPKVADRLLVSTILIL